MLWLRAFSWNRTRKLNSSSATESKAKRSGRDVACCQKSGPPVPTQGILTYGDPERALSGKFGLGADHTVIHGEVSLQGLKP